MPAPAKTPKSPISDWARKPHEGVALEARFNGAPQTVDLKARGAVDELRTLMTNAEAPKASLERALDEVTSSGDEGSLVSVWTCSTPAVDTYKTTFKPDGWDLERFAGNPVVLFAHNRGDLPIGRDIGAWVQPGKALKGVTRYTPATLNPFGDQVGRMVKAGFLSAVSVGFDPIEWEISEERDDGDFWMPPIDFQRQHLLEYSVVPVPSNGEALIEGRNVRDILREANIDVRPFIEWCERALDGEGATTEGGLRVPRYMLERARAAVVPVADGIVLMPSSMVRAEGDEEAPVGDVTMEDDGELEAADEDEGNKRCPMCSYEGPTSEFSAESEPTEEELRTAEGLSTRALLEALHARGVQAGPQVDADTEALQSRLDAIGEHVAKTALRETERILTERTGRLPGSGT